MTRSYGSHNSFSYLVPCKLLVNGKTPPCASNVTPLNSCIRKTTLGSRQSIKSCMTEYVLWQTVIAISAFSCEFSEKLTAGLIVSQGTNVRLFATLHY